MVLVPPPPQLEAPPVASPSRVRPPTFVLRVKHGKEKKSPSIPMAKLNGDEALRWVRRGEGWEVLRGAVGIFRATSDVHRGAGGCNESR